MCCYMLLAFQSSTCWIFRLLLGHYAVLLVRRMGLSVLLEFTALVTRLCHLLVRVIKHVSLFCSRVSN
jgi:hypothetical protein